MMTDDFARDQRGRFTTRPAGPPATQLPPDHDNQVVGTWKTDAISGIPFVYRNGWMAQLLPPEHPAEGSGWRTRCYKFNGAGVITEHADEKTARKAAEAFILAAPPMPSRRTCHWCGLPIRGSYCAECGEQF
ncbi:hypothetical protein [Actinomyces gaoshouyii]|uniref:hypothetical protein n=1 Tax=Actinomyces gaoshouyii TaxID=1960083 RepID=UPI0009BE94DC|nr:hypothetical protein [Actinomyces gaoshouyii]ARD42449.1 hypothetical protein B6G06_08970 [Actinomyces gaoshouyii]